jgi:hypothetical protein
MQFLQTGSIIGLAPSVNAITVKIRSRQRIDIIEHMVVLMELLVVPMKITMKMES